MADAIEKEDLGALQGLLISELTRDGTRFTADDLPLLFESLAGVDDFGLEKLVLTHLERVDAPPEDLVSGYLDYLGSSRKPPLADDVFQRIVDIGGDPAVRGLSDIVSKADGSSRLRDDAARALGRMKNPAAIPALEQALRSVTEPKEAAPYMEALARIGGPRAVSSIVDCAARDGNPAALRAIREIRDVQSAPILADRLRMRPSEEYSRAAARVTDEMQGATLDGALTRVEWGQHRRTMGIPAPASGASNPKREPDRTMMRRSPPPRVPPRLQLLTVLLLAALPLPLLADPTVHVASGSTWALLPGTAEASSPDPAAWRALEFDAAAWARVAAPVGYGAGGPATDLAALDPPMRFNYSSVFLRQTFEIADVSRVVALEADVAFDDGFVLWINGAEVARFNVGKAPGDPVAAGGFARRLHDASAIESIDLPPPRDYLVSGTNVVAVQAFNISLTSTDFWFDLELLDPFGPDVTPPAVERISPSPGITLRDLDRIDVTFSEDVLGVEARDLIVGGLAATSVAGSGRGPWTFRFPRPADGTIPVAWAPEHAIHDRGDPPNAFAGGEWEYTLDAGAPVGEPEISEILAVARSGLPDEDGEPQDWIEIHNSGEIAAPMAGWSLSDDPGDLGQWTFPEVELPAGGYLVVFASGKDRRPADGSPLHASFRLSAAGEFLALSGPSLPRRPSSGFIPRFPEQRSDHSFGPGAEGRGVWFRRPTPGEANDTVTLAGITADPVISVPHGLHEEPFTVEIGTSSADTKVYWTLDGSAPSEGDGTLYETPIEIAGSPGRGLVALRAQAFRPGHLPSRVVTTSYVFPEHVLAQPLRPDGFPATWNGTQGDYLVDPRVIDTPGNRDMALESLRAMPTLSLVTSIADVFDAKTGVYVNPSRSGLAFEREVSAELIPADGRGGFQVQCGLRAQGGSSTRGWKSKKVSLRLLFRGDYGAGRLRYPLFPDTPVESFDTIVLDAHLNLTWTHPSHGQRVRSQYIRDTFVSDLQNAVGSLAPHDIFVHLYLNGLYWGVYDVHERPDESFAADYLGGQEEEYDALRHNAGTFIAGDSRAWIEMFRLARGSLREPAQLDALGEVLDIEDLADYMMVNFYVGNDDWPHQNWYAARRRVPGAGYRFFSWDAEHVLKDVFINQTSVSNSSSPAELYARLRQTPEFRLLFADHVQRAFWPGGPLWVDPEAPDWDPEHPERNAPAALYMKRAREVDHAMVLESARWGDAQRPNQPYRRENEWQNELNWLLRVYFPRRSAGVLNQFRAAGLYPRVPAPELNRASGPVASGTTVTFSLPEGTEGVIWVTSDGSDPRVPFTNGVSPRAVAWTEPLSVEDFTRLRARALIDGQWSALVEGVYTLSAPRDALRISEINYNGAGEADLDFLELWNRSGVTVDLAGLSFSAGVELAFAEGDTIGPGERRVLVADAAAFVSRYPGVPIGGVFNGALAANGERITLSNERGERVLSVRYDDDGLWPIGPDGFGFSLVLADPDGDPDDPASWRASSRPGGSPAEADPPPPAGGAVVISEVLTRSSPPYEDAIELHNGASEPVDISGWYLSDSRDDPEHLRKFRIPDGTTIAAGGYAVFYESEFNATPADPASFALGGTGDDVWLSSANGAGELTGIITGHDFSAARENVSFGIVPTSRGPVFTALASTSFGADRPGSVEEFRAGAGAPNSEPLVEPVVINEIHYHPAAGVEYVELHNLTADPVALYSSELARGWRLRGVRDERGIDSFELPAGTVVPASGFLVVVPVDPAFFRGLWGLEASVPVIGPFSGGLDNGGERLTLLEPLADPEDETDGVAWITIDTVAWDDDEPWPAAADGAGPSLERVRPGDLGDDPLDWEASRRPGGTPGAENSVREPGFDQLPRPAFTADLGIDGNPLAVRLDGSGSIDPDGEITRWEWDLGDGASASGVRVLHTYPAGGRYTVRLEVSDDTGATASTSLAISLIEPPSGGYQIPADHNQDGRLDISDPVSLLRRLFIDGSPPLPCEGDDLQSGGNLALVDSDGNGRVELTDAVVVLEYLFRSGPEPVRGRGCQPISGCPTICSP